MLPSADTQATPPPSKSHQDYIDLLCREIRTVGARFGPQGRAAQPLSTLYLGGGTPSLLHPTLLSRVVSSIRETFGLQEQAELTCEMDPATFTLHSAEAFREIGINRASVGVQSFDDKELAMCRRIHSAADIAPAVGALRSAGFDNISLDLISGLPEQSFDSWRNSLDAIIDLDPEHVSAYDLTLEEGTDFGKRFASGQSPLPNESTAAEMISVAADTLKRAGYEHYEISNYAKRTCRESYGSLPMKKQGMDRAASPFRSRHNMSYWRNEPFYAFGLGSTSVLDGYRFARPRGMSNYRRYVDGLAIGKTAFVGDSMEHEEQLQEQLKTFYPHVEPRTERERLEDFLINAFRLLVDGVQLDVLRAQFGPLAAERFASAVQRNSYFVEQGYLELEYSDPQRNLAVVRLTEQGALIENSILSTLMQDAVWQYPSHVLSVST